MKKTINNIKNKMRVYASLFRALRKMKSFLSPGIYKVHFSPLSKHKLLYPKHLIVIKKYDQVIDSKDTKEIEVAYCSKILVFYNDFVVSFYEKESNRILNIEKYLGELNYPKTHFYHVSVDGGFTITNRIIGDSRFNKTRINHVTRELFKYANNSANVIKPSNCVLSEVKYPNIKYSVQHGDMGWNNMVWTNDTHFYMIDFDTIGVYPTFFDPIVLMTHVKGGIREYFNGSFDKEIYEYMLIHSINNTIDEFKDECLAAAIIVGCKVWEMDLKIRKDTPKNYVLTREALASLELSRQSKDRKNGRT